MAISLVLLWHAVFESTLPNHHYLARILDLGRLSWSGVDLFFVLSGFLIGGILLDAVGADRYFAPFYVRRAYRILPLYALVLLLVFSLTCLFRKLGGSGAWMEFRIPLLYYPPFLQNFWMAKHGSFGSYTLGVTWSLAVEEQFYLTLPLIIRYVQRSRLWWIVAGMIAGAPVLRFVLFLLIPSATKSLFASYVLMPCRADALGWGIAAALIKRTPAAWKLILRLQVYLYIVFGGLVVAIAVLLLGGFKPFTDKIFGLEYSLLAALYFLLLLSVLINRKLELLFSTKVVCHMGTIAYGLYLLHFPFIVAVRDVVAKFHPSQSGWLSVTVSASAVGLATAAASVSWTYLEKPLIKRGHRYLYWRSNAHLALMSATGEPEDISSRPR